MQPGLAWEVFGVPDFCPQGVGQGVCSPAPCLRPVLGDTFSSQSWASFGVHVPLARCVTSDAARGLSESRQEARRHAALGLGSHFEAEV